MGYYQAGDYYRGDGNYAAGGLFSFIGKAAKTVLGLTPVGRAVQAVVPALANPPVIKGLAPGTPLVPTPGFGGTVSRLLPGGDTGYMVGRRRRMNPLNVRALRRAGRRLKGFLKIAGRLGALPVNRGKGKRVFKRKSR